jgi:cyclic pyranopterin phosphate synthase
MPDGIEWLPMEEILTLEEICEVCRQAARIGINKIKVTGGEPLVRKGCIDFIRMLKSIPGIEQVTLTTNGTLLSDYAQMLSEAGISAVNVSLDTLDPQKYAQITGSDALSDVLNGIAAAERCHIPLKINAVLQKGINENDWLALTELAKERSVDVRFIEMMPIGLGKQYETISSMKLLQKMKEHYGTLQLEEKIHGNGPAVYYRIPGFQGSFGFISAVHGKFCNQCNRIRLTSTGKIKPCLCYGETVSLKEALRNGTSDQVYDLLVQAIMQKPAAHRFEETTSITELHEMSKIGG